MSPRLRLVPLAAALLLFTGGRAAVLARFDAGPAGSPVPVPSTPAGGGWTAGVPTADTANFTSAAVAPDGATGWNAWRMLDNSTAGSQFLTWTRALSATDHSAAAGLGWRLSARLRADDPTADNSAGNSIVLLYGNNAGKRWILFLDVNAAGQLVATLVGGPTVTLAGLDPAAHHLHEIVAAPGTGVAEYRVNGQVFATGYAGTTGTFNGVQWGTGSSGGRGDGHWNRVEFSHTDPAGPGGRPVVMAHPASLDRAPGQSATFTAAFTAAAGVQWYRHTTALPGATNAVLTLAAVTPADAGDYWARATNTFGRAETRGAALHVLEGPGDLRIAEFLAENDRGLRDEDGRQTDWIELFNPGTGTVSTAGWTLTDDPLLPAKWPLPAAALIPGERRVVFASGLDRRAPEGRWHANFALQNLGGHLALHRPDTSPATAFTPYPAQVSDTSHGFTASGAAAFFAEPTPGAANADGQSRARPLPVLTPPGLVFTNGVVSVSVSAPPTGTVARVSLDGEPPAFDSPVFTNGFPVAASTHLRVSFLAPGERTGPTASASFLRAAADLAGFNSPLPLVVLHNFGAGAVPGVGGGGPNGDGSDVVDAVPQFHAVTVLASPLGPTTLASPVDASARAALAQRGSSSFNFARKSWSLEFRGERGDLSRDVGPLGLPADDDWVLHAPSPANFDAPLLHNTVAFAIADGLGVPAPRYRFVEVIHNTAGGNLSLADTRGLHLLLERPQRGRNRVDFPHLNDAGTAGGWMVGIDRMDALPAGTVPGTLVPRHFHTAGPDGILQTPDDNARGFQGPGGGTGLPPPRDDQPNFYHSFLNFDSPSGWDILPAQRAAIQGQLRAFDTDLYGAAYTNQITGYARHIDTRDWARMLALHCFTKNQDALVLSGWLYRESAADPIRWGPAWDFDRAFNRNPTNGSATDRTTWAHDRLFFPRLMADPEFAQTYIDVWQEARRGPLADAALLAMVDNQAAVITETVAARSGTTGPAWTASVATLRAWLPARAAALDALHTPPPAFGRPGGAAVPGESVTLAAPRGTVWVTADGTDPRLPGGALRPGAFASTGSVVIASTVRLTARALDGAAWSGPVSADFLVPADFGALRLTELHYHPDPHPGAPLLDEDEFEFLELVNTGATALDLTGVHFTNAVFYAFPAGMSLTGGARAVVARNPAAVAQRWPGVAVLGPWSGKLDNAGETLWLRRGATNLLEIAYDDLRPWAEEADGLGPSLQRLEPPAPGEDPAVWLPAPATPGAPLLLTDTDGDGLPDFFEITHGLSFTNGLDAALDSDGDGRSNREEWLSGTHPRLPAEVLRLELDSIAPGAHELVFRALAQRSYRLQRGTAPGELTDWQVFPPASSSRWLRVAAPVDTAPSLYRLATP